MLTLTRQPYGFSVTRRSLRLTPETQAALARLAPPGLQASAIALAVRLLEVIMAGNATEADELGEVLVAACEWETEELEVGLALMKSAVQRAGREHKEAIEEAL